MSTTMTDAANADTDTTVTGVSEARLLWDDREDDQGDAAGWILRWRDGRGALHTREIAAERTARLDEIVEHVEGAIASGCDGWLGASADIEVIDGEYRREIEVIDGEVTSWSAR